MDELLLDQPEPIAISAIEHYNYCPRQCGLIHVEQTYEENLYTIKGTLAHERVDSGEISSGRGVRSLRAVTLWSEKYGLSGKADLIEFREGRPYPVEYKLGSRRSEHAALQLCAQAICLEEMLGLPVTAGAVYWTTPRQREEVLLDEDLRRRTLAIVTNIREMLVSQRLPTAPNDKRCRHCSLINSCLPGVVAEQLRLSGLQSALFRPYEAKEKDTAEDND